MDQLAYTTAEMALNTQAVASLVRHAIIKLDDDPCTARQYLINAETLLEPVKEPYSWQGLAPWQAKRVKAYIDTHLADHVTLGDLAKLVRLSKSYFSKGFKRSFGEPFQRFLTRQRVEQAQTLIATTKLRLCDVACATGFADQSHFSRAFLQITGATPGRWRRQLNLTMERVTVFYPT